VATAYLGPAGSLSEQAAQEAAAIALVDDELVPQPSITAALDAVERAEVRWAVVPLEDAIVGGVRETVDHLVHEVEEALVLGKVEVAARLHLAVLPGVALDEITTVASHPHALAQCAGHLRGLGIELLEGVGSTSLACRQVAERGERTTAALATPAAAVAAGLEVLPDELTDGDDDHVAFAVVGRGAPVHHDNGKVLVFAVPGRNRPGAVHELLAPFAVRHLNLSRIESRPLSRALGEYGFVLECDGGIDDPDLRAALTELLEERTTVKLLGAYPAPGQRWGRVHQRPLRGRVADRPSGLAALLGPDPTAVDR
jgi:prephenate dehydratase